MLRRILVVNGSAGLHELVAGSVREAWPEAEVDAYDARARGRPSKDFEWVGYDLLVLPRELGLTDEDGLDWLRALRAMHGVPATLFVAAHSDEDVAVRALKLGATDYLSALQLTAERIVASIVAALGMSPGSGEDTAPRPGVGAEVAPAVWESCEGLRSERAGTPTIPGYRILRVLADRGLSSVYLACDEEREVAIKVIYAADASNPKALERCLEESVRVGQLGHANLAGVYDWGQLDSFAYLVMEHLTDGNLCARIATGLAQREALELLRQAAMGLAAAHDAGIVHCDVKPANILFRQGGTLAVADFGISRPAGAQASSCVLMDCKATPHYMSPEQVEGLGVDPRSDLYSLGVVFHEMLTGALPYPSSRLTDVLNAHLNAPVPTLPERHANLQPVLDKLLAKDADHRYESARALISDLAERTVLSIS